MATYVAEDLNDPTLYFETLIWTGDGNTPRTLTGLDFAPNMIWSKRRDDAAGHNVLDSVRGAGVDAELCPSSDGVEGSNNQNAYGYLSAFTSDGFTVTAGSSDNAYWNNNTATYVAWCWKESATAGFDIVTYTGNETARTISHSLSAKPRVIICKGRSVASNWTTQHGSYGAEKQFQLQETDAIADHATTWNDAEPTTSVFSVGTGTACNDNGETFVAYLWSEKQGYSKFGGWTGNGNADGPYIYLGFRPAWIMYKTVDQADNWEIHNNKTDTFNPMDTILYANRTNAESDPASTTDRLDITANGFKIRTGSSDYNGSGNTYIYMAFAEAPFVNSKGVPCNAR